MRLIRRIVKAWFTAILKPANIILTKSGAKLSDFGLAKPSFGSL